MPDTTPSQDAHAAAKNTEFFAANEAYAERVARLTTYRNIRAVVDREVAGVNRLLDVGNGGVFDYDVGLVKEVVGVDLFLDEYAQTTLPPHVTLRRGDALDLDEHDATYDAVLLAFVFHHLTGVDAAALIHNVDRALSEARRVLRPGGKLIVAESCVAGWVVPVERILFKPLVALSRTPLLGDHPPTLQLSVNQLRGQISDCFGTVDVVERIPVGRVMLQFGRRWPSALTPARPWLLTARRD